MFAVGSAAEADAQVNTIKNNRLRGRLIVYIIDLFGGELEGRGLGVKLGLFEGEMFPECVTYDGILTDDTLQGIEILKLSYCNRIYRGDGEGYNGGKGGLSMFFAKPRILGAHIGILIVLIFMRKLKISNYYY